MIQQAKKVDGFTVDLDIPVDVVKKHRHNSRRLLYVITGADPLSTSVQQPGDPNDFRRCMLQVKDDAIRLTVPVRPELAPRLDEALDHLREQYLDEPPTAGGKTIPTVG